MPENNQTHPDFLTELAKYNAINGVGATFSEMKKTARRIERAYNDRPAALAEITIHEYLRILYSDPTADTAIAHVENPDECDHHAFIEFRQSRKLVSA